MEWSPYTSCLTSPLYWAPSSVPNCLQGKGRPLAWSSGCYFRGDHSLWATQQLEVPLPTVRGQAVKTISTSWDGIKQHNWISSSQFWHWGRTKKNKKHPHAWGREWKLTCKGEFYSPERQETNVQWFHTTGPKEPSRNSVKTKQQPKGLKYH